MSLEAPVAEPTHAAVAPLLEVRDLAVRYGGVLAVRGVSFDVAPGEIVGLVGPNGAGKSSLLAALGGQIRTSAGSIRLRGNEITTMPPHQRAHVGIARSFQMTSEFEGLTVLENLLVAGRSREGSSLVKLALRPRHNAHAEQEAAERAWRLLEDMRFAYAANNYGRELSGGERRLVELLRCLMQQPALLLLDEPTVGVAPHLVPSIVANLARIRELGVTLVFVEHALEVVHDLADRVLMMADGQVIAEGSYDDVVALEAVREAYLG